MLVASWAQRGGGAEQMLWTYLTAPVTADVRFVVVFLESGPLVADVERLGHVAYVVPAGRLRQPVRFASAVASLRRLIAAERPDTVVAWSAKAQLYVAPAAVLAGASDRVVWWQHMIPDGAWIDLVATKLPARAIGCSSAAAATAQARMGPRPTFVVHPGVAAEIFEPGTGDSGGVRTPAAPPPGRSHLEVAVVGRLDRWKRQDAVLRAVAQLRASGKDVSVIVVGGDAFELTGEFSAELRALAAEMFLEDHVRFTGQVADIVPFLSAADVVVNASENEPFGIVLIEAMAMGLPVVAVANGGPLEIVDDGQTGILIDDGEPESIASALTTLYDDRATARAMGERGRVVASQRFSPAAMAERMTAMLRPRREVTIVVQDVGPVGGMERHVWEVAGGLLEDGWHVTVVAFTCLLPPHPHLTFRRVPGPRRPFPLAYPWFLIASSAVVKLRGRGIVHSHGAVLGARSDVSTVHFCHQAFSATGTPRRARRRGLAYSVSARLAQRIKVLGERWVYREGRVRALVAISRGVEDEARAWLSTGSERVARIPHGVDHERFRPSPQVRRATRHELAVGDDELALLFVGGEWDRKGLRPAIEAVALAPGWRLLVAGDGDVRRFADIAEHAGAVVDFLGRRSDAPALFAAADAFVLPSAYETFSLAAHEAAAAGLPLLCGRTHGIDELLEDGVNGWFVPAEKDTIAGRLDVLRGEPELRQRLGAAARAASRRYTWARTVAEHEALYEQLLAEDGPSAKRRRRRSWR